MNLPTSNLEGKLYSSISVSELKLYHFTSPLFIITNLKKKEKFKQQNCYNVLVETIFLSIYMQHCFILVKQMYRIE